MLGDTHVIVLGDIHPFRFVFENFADGAALHTVASGNVFLAGIGIILMVHTNGLAVDIEETLLALLCAGHNRTYRWGREWICGKRLRVGCGRGGRRNRGEGGSDAQRGGGGARIGRGVGRCGSGVGGVERKGRARDGGREIAGGREGHGGAGGGDGVDGCAFVGLLEAGRVGGADGGLWAGEGAGGGHEVGGLWAGQAWQTSGERGAGTPRRSHVWRTLSLCRGGGWTGHVPGDSA